MLYHRASHTAIVATLLWGMLGGLLGACGRAGESETVACVLCGPRNDLRGSIAAKNGSQAQMQGWVVATFERDTGIARVSEVDSAGLFNLLQVKTSMAQTIAVLSPDYVLQAVLSIPGVVEKTIRQFVRFNAKSLPKLIHNGPIVSFQDYNGLIIERDVASDLDGDQIPDGAVSLGAADTSAASGTGTTPAAFGLTDLPLRLADSGATVDTDLDGTPNLLDPDIDGDGIINWLDQDDNNNQILDVFDGDANGDLVNDATPGQKNGDFYFKEGVDFIAVQYTMKPRDDGTYETSLTFTTRVRDDVVPLAVQIRGAPSLLNGATYLQADSSGVPTKVAWNRLLNDDGVSEDASAGDRLFAKHVVLEGTKAPRGNEMVFFQLVFGTSDQPWYLEFPYTFPHLKPAAISAKYDPNTRNVLLVGNPFGEYQDFIWTTNVYDSADRVIWTSQGVPGITRQFVIPDNVLISGESYKFSVVAQTLDKVPGYPSYAIYSKKTELK